MVLVLGGATGFSEWSALTCSLVRAGSAPCLALGKKKVGVYESGAVIYQSRSQGGGDGKKRRHVTRFLCSLAGGAQDMRSESSQQTGSNQSIEMIFSFVLVGSIIHAYESCAMGGERKN